MSSLIRLLMFPNRKLYFDSTSRNKLYTKKRITDIINELNTYFSKLGKFLVVLILINYIFTNIFSKFQLLKRIENPRSTFNRFGKSKRFRSNYKKC